MNLSARLRPLVSLVAVLLVLSGSYCKPKKQTVAQLLQNRGLQNAFYTCLLNGLAQHLPLKQAQKDCEAKLTFNGGGGLGTTTPDLGPAGRNQSAYDPASVKAVCDTGDPGRAGGRAGAGFGSIDITTIHGDKMSFGYTYGGKGQKTGDYATNEHGEVGVGVYKGLSKDDAERQKQKDADEYQEANNELAALVAKQNAELDAAGKDRSAWEDDPQMKQARDAAYKKFEEAYLKAKNDDPNVEVKGITSTAQSSACEDALQSARETLGQCQMTNWKSGDCQSLQAKLQDCPDPALIYVDPEVGYTCRPSIDPAAVKQAWVDRCHQLKRPTPGGPDPCAPPDVDSDSRYITGNQNSVCGGPQVYVTPDNTNPDRSCVHELILPNLDKTTQQIYVWGLNNLGGPIVVFGPRGGTNPSPTPGPEPRPGPNPQ